MTRRALLVQIALLGAGCTSPTPRSPPPPTSLPATATLTATNTPQATNAAPTRALPPPNVLVDARASRGPISRLAFGSNTGPWQNLTRAMRADLDHAGLGLLRFPGGNWGDEHVLSDKQLDDFVTLCRAIGAEPLINVKLPQQSPAEAAAWVRRANLERNLGITYWGIGNEPSLYQSQRSQQAATWDTTVYNAQWRAFASAMKGVDGHIKLIGPETHQFTGQPGADPVDSAGRDWLGEFLRANGDLVDVVAVHRYPFGAALPSPEALLANAAEWDAIVPALRTAVRTRTGHDLPVAVTEVNSNYTNVSGKETSPDSVLGALWWADVQGRLLQQGVGMVAHFALADAGGLGMLDSSGPQPIFSVFELWAALRGELLEATSEDATLRVYAARREDDHVALLILNSGTTELRRDVALVGLEARTRSLQTRQFDAAGLRAQPSTLVGDRFTATFGARSVTLLDAG